LEQELNVPHETTLRLDRQGLPVSRRIFVRVSAYAGNYIAKTGEKSRDDMGASSELFRPKGSGTGFQILDTILTERYN
jgi:hypothetical protein